MPITAALFFRRMSYPRVDQSLIDSSHYASRDKTVSQDVPAPHGSPGSIFQGSMEMIVRFIPC
jgi:hypothetical protein